LDELARNEHDIKPNTFVGGFRCAWLGVVYMVRTQRNARIHLIMAALAVGLSWVLGLSPGEWAIILLVIGMVLAAEGFNTVAEVTVDLATAQQYMEAARIAKDVAAGAVLITAIIATVVGAVIFIPHIMAVIPK
jgi:diacylglycerol kinase (ATP)